MNVQKDQSDCPCCGRRGEKFEDASNHEDRKHRYHCSGESCPVEMFTAPEALE